MGIAHVSAHSSRFTLLRRQPLIEIAEYASIRTVSDKLLCVNVPLRNSIYILLQGENKGKVVLQGVTGHVRSGEVTAVMGPSGAGKTTFLNTLSGKAYYGVSLSFCSRSFISVSRKS